MSLERITLSVLMFAQLLGISICCAYSVEVNAQNTITPSHVYQQANDIYSEILLIRKDMNVQDSSRDPGVQTNKLPIHVYTKGLEILEKIAKLQSSQSISPVKVPDIPLTNINPGDVFQLTQTLLEELRKIKVKRGIVSTIIPSVFKPGQIPSNVYERLWQASFLLDGTVPAISPSEVYKNTLKIIAELELIAAHFKVNLPDVKQPANPEKKPRHVNMQGYLNLHQLSELEDLYGMTAFRIPSYPLNNISPADVYDTTNMLLAELTRIKVKLAIMLKTEPVTFIDNKTPPEVLVNMILISDEINFLINTAKNNRVSKQ